MLRKLLSQIALLLFSAGSIFAQPDNDDCLNAQLLCGNSTLSGTVSNASSECGGADGDCLSTGSWGQCYNVSNSVWYRFFTNHSGGSISISITNIQCGGVGSIDAVLIQAGNPCDASSYTGLDCVNGANGNLTLSAGGLLPQSYYYVQVNGEDLSNCTFEIMASGEAIEPHMIIMGDSAHCSVEAGTITVTSVSWGQSPYIYTLDGHSQTTNVFEGVAVGNYEILVEDALGCIHPAYATVEEQNNVLVADAGEGATLIVGETRNLVGVGTGSGSAWSPITNLTGQYPNEVVFTATAPGSYQYVFTTWTDEQCSASDTITIIVLPPLKVFNAFTPNGDGFNDTWTILNASYYDNLVVSVFSRWGQVVHRSKGYPAGEEWDGTSDGKDLPVGVYYYVLELNTEGDKKKKEKQLSGSLTIMR